MKPGAFNLCSELFTSLYSTTDLKPETTNSSAECNMSVKEFAKYILQNIKGLDIEF